ncbi:hypothetical protein OF117_03750 [Geodermatophilus sp. YIM 151500]|uniref:hypothetical protein n=1 Tax=Geodermatophilus sp. YIM 151500 TaxID=2984531 RepID=UPI0021E48BA8|nr:hypothetical protein [Geodermatophilus sp. YIM 151500]MCV2488467.1 hypothetical protein [Geodermatophilus sp. YIM 151500]
MADNWQPVYPLETEDVSPPRRRVDLAAFVPGVAFVVLALVVMTGLDLGFLADGGLLWLVLIGAGVVLLVSELRKARRRSG